MNAPSIRISRLQTSWRIAAISLQLKLARLRLTLKAGFDPNQPRVPAGEPDGGRWTDAGSTSTGGFTRYDRPQWAESNETFAVAQASGRGSGPRGRGGAPLTPSQSTSLEVAHSQANAAVAKVRALDPNWSPSAGVYNTVGGQIAHYRAMKREAIEHYTALRTIEVSFGKYAVERAPGPGAFRRPTAEQQREVNRLGALYGCHTCGTRESGFSGGHWIFDHQGVSALGGPNAGRWGVPHCALCSWRSGARVKEIRYYRSYLYEQKSATWAAILHLLHFGRKFRGRA